MVHEFTLTLLSDCLIQIGSQILFFAFGWIFLVKKLFKDYESSTDRRDAQSFMENQINLSSLSDNFSTSLTDSTKIPQGDVFIQFGMSRVSVIGVFQFDAPEHEFLRQVTDADIQAAEKKYIQTLDIILSKKRRILISQARQRSAVEQGSRVGGFMRKMINTMVNHMGIGGENIGMLRQEVVGLENLSRQLFIDIDDLYQERFFRAVSNSVSRNDIVLLLAQIMGMYFLRSIEFSFYHRWFDVIFLVSGLASVVFLYFVHQANKSNVMLSSASMSSISPGSSGGSSTTPTSDYTTNYSPNYSPSGMGNSLNNRVGDWEHASGTSRWVNTGLYHRD
ncbi:9683_t:CDS:2, partial [Cetraspora pellucida]